MPYISATAEIMYAPLDLRFVITLKIGTALLPSSMYNKNDSATDDRSVSCFQNRHVGVRFAPHVELAIILMRDTETEPLIKP